MDQVLGQLAIPAVILLGGVEIISFVAGITLGAAGHQQGEPGGPGGVPELRQLALVELACLAALVALDRGLRPLGPVHARKCTAPD